MGTATKQETLDRLQKIGDAMHEAFTAITPPAGFWETIEALEAEAASIREQIDSAWHGAGSRSEAA
jgi:hypothetical protein